MRSWIASAVERCACGVHGNRGRHAPGGASAPRPARHRIAPVPEPGWIDHVALVSQLDEVLESEGATSLFYAYCSIEFGQYVAFAYLPKTTGERLATLVQLREESDLFEQFSPPPAIT